MQEREKLHLGWAKRSSFCLDCGTEGAVGQVNTFFYVYSANDVAIEFKEQWNKRTQLFFESDINSRWNEE